MLGTGWLGLPLSQFLVDNGFNVKGSTRSAERFGELLKSGINPFHLDLENSHFGEDTFFNSDILIINIPYKGIVEFATFIHKIEQSKISKVIFISSTSVYGNKDDEILEQDLDCLIPCPLLTIENLFTSNKHFTTTVLRFAGLIGYNRNPALFFKNNRQVKDPDSPVNMIHRDDCLNIISLIIEKNAWGEIYNCCADTHPTKRAFYTYAAIQSQLPKPYFSKLNNNGSKIISNRKVKSDLAYDFIHHDLLNLPFNNLTNSINT